MIVGIKNHNVNTSNNYIFLDLDRCDRLPILNSRYKYRSRLFKSLLSFG